LIRGLISWKIEIAATFPAVIGRWPEFAIITAHLLC